VNILLCGDVVGRAGREAIKRHLPALKRDLSIDVAIVNAENAAHGFGLNERLAGELYDAGADILSTGNHVWDQRELIQYIERDSRILRPANFPQGTPGAGWRLHPVDGDRTRHFRRPVTLDGNRPTLRAGSRTPVNPFRGAFSTLGRIHRCHLSRPMAGRARPS
jgi:hypothetical protein